MKIFFLLCALTLSTLAHAAEEDLPLPPPNTPAEKKDSRSRANPSLGAKLWYRDAADYLASRSVRIGRPTEPSTKLITDGKRFDAIMGKRISLLTWGEEGPTETWSLGVDGGMLASLTRYKKNNQLTFATNTFDGFFGAYVGYLGGGWLAMLRVGHLSAHLVDSSPDILNPIIYSQFWNELIVGKSFPSLDEPSDWDLHLQGSVGSNYTSSPSAKQPRAALGLSTGWAPGGPDKIAFLLSADAFRAGVKNQKNSYSFFFGFGTLNRPESTRRPFRIGVAHFTGSDYRNQYFKDKQNWTTAEISTEF